MKALEARKTNELYQEIPTFHNSFWKINVLKVTKKLDRGRTFLGNINLQLDSTLCHPPGSLETTIFMWIFMIFLCICANSKWKHIENWIRKPSWMWVYVHSVTSKTSKTSRKNFQDELAFYFPPSSNFTFQFTPQQFFFFPATIITLKKIVWNGVETPDECFAIDNGIL